MVKISDHVDLKCVTIINNWLIFLSSLVLSWSRSTSWLLPKRSTLLLLLNASVHDAITALSLTYLFPYGLGVYHVCTSTVAVEAQTFWGDGDDKFGVKASKNSLVLAHLTLDNFLLFLIFLSFLNFSLLFFFLFGIIKGGRSPHWKFKEVSPP